MKLFSPANASIALTFEKIVETLQLGHFLHHCQQAKFVVHRQLNGWRLRSITRAETSGSLGTLSTDDGDGNGDVGTERKDWGENAVVARILNIKHLPNLQT